MCFSATASFTAAAVLSLIGAVSIKSVKEDKSLFFLACIPLLFALQQASEGLLWLKLSYGIEGLTGIGKYLFMIIAFLIWPIFIPFAIWKAEKIHWRKNIISFFLAAGIIWSIYQAYTLFYINPTAHIVNQSIQYTANYYSENALQLLTLTYIVIVTAPCFISSLRYLWFFGVFSIISAYFSQAYYRENFTSVWCFFAALISMILYFTLRSAVSKHDKELKNNRGSM